MKTKKKMIVGNWKMNPGTLDEAKKIAKGTVKAAEMTKKVEVVVCPPFVFLSEVKKILGEKKVFLGSQDIHFEDSGSRTGYVSPVQTKNLGATHTIIGHSERRERGESDEIVNKKIAAALRGALVPIFCFGEKERNASGAYLEYIKMQISEGLRGVSKTDAEKIIFAYEPVWAIGAKEAMTPNDVYEMMLYVRKVLRELFDAEVSDTVRVLYGGSVSPQNAGEIMKGGATDGLLVGRDSLVPENFGEIIHLANEIK